MLCEEVLLSDCSIKEREGRKKMMDIFGKLLNYIGLIKLKEEEEKDEPQIISYTWNSQFTNILTSSEIRLNEFEYFQQRKKVNKKFYSG